MTKRTLKDQDDELDAIFGALAHPMRRDLLEQLSEGPRIVGELADPYDVSLAAVSNHLHALEEAGLAEFEKDGRVRRGRLAVGPLNMARDWLNQPHFSSDARQEPTAVHSEEVEQ